MSDSQKPTQGEVDAKGDIAFLVGKWNETDYVMLSTKEEAAIVRLISDWYRDVDAKASQRVAEQLAAGRVAFLKGLPLTPEASVAYTYAYRAEEGRAAVERELSALRPIVESEAKTVCLIAPHGGYCGQCLPCKARIALGLQCVSPRTAASTDPDVAAVEEIEGAVEDTLCRVLIAAGALSAGSTCAGPELLGIAERYIVSATR